VEGRGGSVDGLAGVVDPAPPGQQVAGVAVPDESVVALEEAVAPGSEGGEGQEDSGDEEVAPGQRGRRGCGLPPSGGRVRRLRVTWGRGESQLRSRSAWLSWAVKGKPAEPSGSFGSGAGASFRARSRAPRGEPAERFSFRSGRRRL